MTNSPGFPAEYELDETGRIIHSYILASGNKLVIAATNIRRERGRPHALLRIEMNQVGLAWGDYNIDKDEDRTRITNSAYGHLDDIDREGWSRLDNKKALDEFCYGLWANYIGTQLGEEMEGDPDIGPPKKLLGEYVQEGGGTILYSPPGRGKSYTAGIWAVCIDANVTSLWPVRQRKVCYVNLERSKDSMRYRLARINRALGLSERRPLTFINARGKSLSDVEDAIRETMREKGCEVLILDSISRSGFGSLVDDTAANRIVDVLNSLCPTWVALGHTPRSDESHIFGSTMFDAGEDVGIQLVASTNGSRTGIGLKGTKANDGPLARLSVIALTWSDRGLERIERSSSGDFPGMLAGEKPDPYQEIREYLLLVGKADAETIAKNIGGQRTHISEMLNASNEIGKERNGHRVLFYIKTQTFE